MSKRKIRERYSHYRSPEKFTRCPKCGEQIPLSIFVRHLKTCSEKKGEKKKESPLGRLITKIKGKIGKTGEH